ncbi:hypothetical protein AB0D34_06450 [Streptomyces sp. NPDC048420]|uniref:hypothetical protein n=1 Tax=Streptomyces sp. NPDC048420 TaxID=3155755 RepID=UPI00341B7D42
MATGSPSRAPVAVPRPVSEQHIVVRVRIDRVDVRAHPSPPPPAAPRSAPAARAAAADSSPLSLDTYLERARRRS